MLQLIGLAYLFAAFLYELPLRRRLIVAGGLLLSHWAAIRFIPIPGVGAGIFTEKQNLINHLNQVYLQPLGLRGIFSVVPTTALVLMGTAIGDLFRHENYPVVKKIAYLLTSGIVLLVISWIWNLQLPFNKPVWTSSYILFAAGWGTLLLGFLYLLIDVTGWRAWAFPLIVFGSNALFAYVVPIIIKAHLLQEWQWKLADGSVLSLQQVLMNFCFMHAGRIPGGWLYTMSYIVFWWLILLLLYRKQVFFRV